MTCSKCKDGLIPFIGKEGKVILGAFIYCPDCHQDEPERYQPTKVEDYDFPCSTDFRAYTYRYCGQPDPGAVTVKVEREVEVRYRPRPIDNEIDQLKAGLTHIHNEVMELKAKKKLAGKSSSKVSYKGIK